MPQCQFSVFCCFCVSEKLHRKYSQNWTKQKLKSLITWHKDEVRRWDGGEPGARHTLGWRGQPLAHATRGWASLAHLLTLPLRLYNSLNGKYLRDGSLFHKIYCKPPPSLSWDREDLGALPGTLLERGIPAGGLLHHHGRLRSNMWVVYLGLRVHSSS
jgi:hypothetical protein